MVAQLPTPTPNRRTRAAARAAVLATLRAAYPAGVGTMPQIELHGPSAQSRVGELVDDGWQVATDTTGTVAVHRLASLTNGAEDPADAGCILRLGRSSGWAARTHSTARRGPVRVEVLAEAQEAAEAAYRGVLLAHGLGYLLGGGIADHPLPRSTR